MLMKKEDVEVIKKEDIEIEENKWLIPLKTPYFFEGKEYNEIDLKNLENLRGIDLIEANKAMTRSGVETFVQEGDPTYIFTLAAKAMDVPIEFFYNLPASVATIVKRRAGTFLLVAGL